jgi:hypothetical protein
MAAINPYYWVDSVTPASAVHADLLNAKHAIWLQRPLSTTLPVALKLIDDIATCVFEYRQAGVFRKNRDNETQTIVRMCSNLRALVPTDSSYFLWVGVPRDECALPASTAD